MRGLFVCAVIEPAKKSSQGSKIQVDEEIKSFSEASFEIEQELKEDEFTDEDNTTQKNSKQIIILDTEKSQNNSPVKQARGGLSSRRFFDRGAPCLQIEPQITQSSGKHSVKQEFEMNQGSFKLKMQQVEDKDFNDSKADANQVSKDFQLNREMTLKDVEKELLQQIKNNIDSPEPILDLSHKYAYGSDSPAWKKRQIRNVILKKEKKEEKKIQQIESESNSLSSERNSQKDEMPRENISDDSDYESNKEGKSQKKKPKQKNSNIQEKLKEVGSKIQIQTHRAIVIEKHPGLFKYQVYDCYRPSNLAQTRDYFNYLTSSSMDDLDSDAPQNLIDYCSQDINTKIPETINQKLILNFDSNFESGNIDSVYIHNITTISQEYNLLMKVDTNTRGNTYWFYFKVTNFIIGMKYKFNILNFTRSLEQFYQQGMNIVTRAEKPSDSELNVIQEDKNENEEFLVQKNELESPENKTLSESLSSTSSEFSKENGYLKKTEWRYNTCDNIVFENSELPKSYIYNSPPYMSLRFSYIFKPEDEGKHIYFAYAVPYTYTQLTQDLKKAKLKLLSKQIEMNRSLEYLEDPHQNIQQISPIFRLINKKDYLDKKQNNQDQLDLISSNIQNSKSLSYNKTFFEKLGNTSFKKKNHFDWEHDQITKFAQKQSKQRQNLFESKILNQKHKEEIKNMSEIISRENKNLFNLNIDFNGDPLQIQYAQNFEIQNQYIHYRQEVIAQSMGGLNIYQLTITKRREAGSIKHKKKKIIYIQSRLHAAETHGSLVMNEIINELTQNYKQYDQLLHNTIIKIIPMINPDGVVIGNSRSSLAGVDLNRRWANPNATIHPEIYFLKNNIRATFEQSAGISIFCDLHGHNRQMNCFFYGSNKAPNEGLISWTKTRLLPKIFAKYEPIFNFNFCKFQNHKTKYNTARVVMWNEFKVTNSFTLETSMYGKRNLDTNQKQFNRKYEQVSQLVSTDFKSIAQNLLNAFSQYVQLEPVLEKEFKQTGGWLKKKKLDEFTQSNPNQLQKQSDLQISSSFREQKTIKQIDGIKKKPKRNYSFFQKAESQLQKKLSFNKGQSTRNVLNQLQNTKLVQINESQNSKQTFRDKTILKTNEEISIISKEKSAIIEEVSQIDGSIQGSQMSMHSQNQLTNKNKLKVTMKKSPSQHLIFSNKQTKDQKIDQGFELLKIKEEKKLQQNENVEQKQNYATEKDSVSSQKINTGPQKKNKFIDQKQSIVQKQEKNSKKQVQTNPQSIVKQNTKKQKDGDDNEILECLAQYFSKNEFEFAMNEAQKKQKTLKKEEVSDIESDSQPSCDNVDTKMFQEIFGEALSDTELQQCFQAEQTPKDNFKKLKSNISVVKNFTDQLKLSSQKFQPQKTSPIVQVQYPFPIQETQSSFNDIRVIAQRVMEAETLQKKLTDQFSKLQKEINRKIKEEKNRVGKILFQPIEPIPQNQIQQGILSGRSNFTSNQINFGEQFIPNLQNSFTPKQAISNNQWSSPFQIQNFYQIQQSNFYNIAPNQSLQFNKKEDLSDQKQKIKSNQNTDTKNKPNDQIKDFNVKNQFAVQKDSIEQSKYGMFPPVFNNSMTFKNLQNNLQSPKNLVQNELQNQKIIKGSVQKNATMINITNQNTQEQMNQQNISSQNFNKKMSLGQRTIRNNQNELKVINSPIMQNQKLQILESNNIQNVDSEKISQQFLSPLIKKKETIKLVVTVMPSANIENSHSLEQKIEDTFSINNENSIMSQKQLKSSIIPSSPSQHSKLYSEFNQSSQKNERTENHSKIISRSVNYSQENSQIPEQCDSQKAIIYSQNIFQSLDQFQNQSTPVHNAKQQKFQEEPLKQEDNKNKPSGQISPATNSHVINQYYQNMQRKIIKLKSRQQKQPEISVTEVGLNINKLNLSQRDELVNQKARQKQKEIQSPEFVSAQNDQSFYQRSAFKNNRTRNTQNMVPLNQIRNFENKKRENNVIKLQQIQGSYTIMNMNDYNLGEIQKQEFKTQQQEQIKQSNILESQNDQFNNPQNQIMDNEENEENFKSPESKFRQINSPIKEQYQINESRPKPNIIIQRNKVHTTSLMSPIFSNQFNHLLNNNLNIANDSQGLESPLIKKQAQEKYLTPSIKIETPAIQDNVQQLFTGQKNLNNNMKKLYMKLNQSQNITEENLNLQEFGKKNVNFKKFRDNFELMNNQKKLKKYDLTEDLIVKAKNIDFQSNSLKRNTNDKKFKINIQ